MDDDRVDLKVTKEVAGEARGTASSVIDVDTSAGANAKGKVVDVLEIATGVGT